VLNKAGSEASRRREQQQRSESLAVRYNAADYVQNCLGGVDLLYTYIYIYSKQKNGHFKTISVTKRNLSCYSLLSPLLISLVKSLYIVSFDRSIIFYTKNTYFPCFS
jgi:hypothetical protein